ncbi:hypothetical protein GCM10007897_33280 [Sphingobium jiangsuense]|nr:hypothetical protein GCM10007897_33280 [Sphingobium jiangsuense]
MLDDITVRPLAEQPAGKGAPPLVVLRGADVELDEGADLLLLLPRRGCLARAQADDRVAHAQRLAGLHLEVARQAVALVEQADHGHALLHRGRAGGIDRRDERRAVARLPDGAGGIALRQLIRSVAAGLHHQRKQQRSPGARRPHQASGFHAS